MIFVMITVFTVCAAALSLAITPAAAGLGILDRPDKRKIHDRPVPKAGGIGIFIPVLALATAAFLFTGTAEGLASHEYLTTIPVTLALMITGLADDRFDLNYKLKLLLQLSAAAATVLAGVRFHMTGILPADQILTAAWITGMINAVNLIDGLDGLAAGVAALSGIGFCTAGCILGANSLVFFSAIMVGSCLGFLKYNFRPAKIFMGDTGSLPLGYHLAVSGILCVNSVKDVTAIVIPVVVLGIPIYDTLLSMIRRLVNHKPIFKPDRSHFYNLMMDVKGLSHRKTVWVIYFINMLLAAAGVLLVFCGNTVRIAALGLLMAAAVFLGRKMHFIKADRNPGGRQDLFVP